MAVYRYLIRRLYKVRNLKQNEIEGAGNSYFIIKMIQFLRQKESFPQVCYKEYVGAPGNIWYVWFQSASRLGKNYTSNPLTPTKHVSWTK